MINVKDLEIYIELNVSTQLIDELIDKYFERERGDSFRWITFDYCSQAYKEGHNDNSSSM